MPGKTMRAQQYAPRTSSNLNLELPSFSFDKESLVAGTNLPAPSREPSPAPPTLQKQKRESQMDPLRSHPTTPDNSSPAPGDRARTHENGSAGPTSNPDPSMANKTGNGNQANAPMATPGMKRPHHVRRLLSIKSLSQAFASQGRSESSMSGTTAAGGAGSAAGAGEGSDFGPPKAARSRTPSIFGRSSTSTWGMRPESRGGWSTVGSTADGVADGGSGRQKLRKRMSGAFWSRRNSMTMTRLVDDKIDESPNEATAAANQRKKTPPPQLPEIGKLKVGNQLRGEDGGFLNGDDMFKGIEYKPEI